MYAGIVSIFNGQCSRSVHLSYKRHWVRCRHDDAIMCERASRVQHVRRARVQHVCSTQVYASHTCADIVCVSNMTGPLYMKDSNDVCKLFIGEPALADKRKIAS